MAEVNQRTEWSAVAIKQNNSLLFRLCAAFCSEEICGSLVGLFHLHPPDHERKRWRLDVICHMFREDVHVSRFA